MNIAAVMAALRIRDLAHNPKVVLLAVCCHAGQHNAAAEVGTSTLAADVEVHYDTARRALRHLETCGYLSGARRPGRSTIWTINLAVLDREVSDATLCSGSGLVRGSGPRPPRGSGPRRKESLDKREGGGNSNSNRAVAVAARNGNGNGTRPHGWISTTSKAVWVELADGTVVPGTEQ